jgi:hypothetical protein
MTPYVRSACKGGARSCCAVWIVVLVAACSASQKRPMVATALDNEETRIESFEATLRVLDAHPEYVDELFARALKHPATLDRLLEDTARELASPDLAKRTARHLAAHPAGLRMVFIHTLDEVRDRPAALDAMADAIEARPRETVLALTRDEQAVRAAVRELLARVQKDQATERAFLRAMEDNRRPLGDLLARNPDVLKDVTAATAQRGLSRMVE